MTTITATKHNRNLLRMPIMQRFLALLAISVVIGLVLGNWLWIDDEFLLSSRALKLKLILLFLYFLLAYATSWVMVLPKRKLDERQRSLRTEMIQKTYRAIFWGVIAAYLLGEIILRFKAFENPMPSSFWQFTSRGMWVHAFNLTLQYCLTGLVLPVAFLAWREAKLAKKLD